MPRAGLQRKLVLHSTAFNLGLVDRKSGAMPSLVEALLPPASSVTGQGMRLTQGKLADLLLNPPTAEVARHISAAIMCAPPQLLRLTAAHLVGFVCCARSHPVAARRVSACCENIRDLLLRVAGQIPSL